MRDHDGLSQLVEDARRFIMYHKGAIEGYPLQAYASVLLFSPTGSLIRRLFQHEEPKDVTIRPDLSDSWSACLQTLEGHSQIDNLVGFETQQPIHQGIGISSDRTWITHNAQKRLWLPSEYRPARSAVSGRCVAIGTGSGHVWIFCQK
jgi:hypothetical protein